MLPSDQETTKVYYFLSWWTPSMLPSDLVNPKYTTLWPGEPQLYYHLTWRTPRYTTVWPGEPQVCYPLTWWTLGMLPSDLENPKLCFSQTRRTQVCYPLTLRTPKHASVWPGEPQWAMSRCRKTWSSDQGQFPALCNRLSSPGAARSNRTRLLSRPTCLLLALKYTISLQLVLWRYSCWSTTLKHFIRYLE